MALFFSSGGGRFGNQILNLIHLMAISYEYNIEVFKLTDPFFVSKDGSFFYKLEKFNNKWKINQDYKNHNLLNKYLLKCYIRLIHFYFYTYPFSRSYKIGSKPNYPKYILGKNLKNNFSLAKLIKQSYKLNIVISGWGLRDWDLVLKHKNLILNNLLKEFNILKKEIGYLKKNYLLVHIRRSDFLEVNEFQVLNFTDEIWLKSIMALCSEKTIKDVVIFSDSTLKKSFISNLKINGIKVFLPEKVKKNYDFLGLFYNFVTNSSSVLCNGSSLVLGISFLSHQHIFLPSVKRNFQKVNLNEAHESFPTSLNWN